MAFARRMAQHGRDRVQISPWRSTSTIASFVPFAAADALEPAAVNEAMRVAREQGYTTAYTAALAPPQAEPFLVAGFELLEELHLLRRNLDDDPPTGPARLRRGRRTDHDGVLAFDQAAFDDFWRFDRASLIDAMRATPRHRFAVSRTDPVVGYHITGLAGANAYVQRVAVDPSHHGHGWGTCLVNDSLRWSARNGASVSHVNTQVTNDRAVALYEKCGFRLAPYRLMVLQRRLI